MGRDLVVAVADRQRSGRLEHENRCADPRDRLVLGAARDGEHRALGHDDGALAGLVAEVDHQFTVDDEEELVSVIVCQTCSPLALATRTS